MNILIPHSWLLEHLETDATPQEIQQYLSLCGPSVERIYEREGESVYDIEVTTNRVDSMSVRGIAREAAVILPQFGKKARLKPLDIPEVKAGKGLPLPKIVNDPKLCKRVMCVALKDVQRTPTPELMAKRLRQVEMNVHDSAIDITNYVTHDLGHPCHAFDYDKIMALGGEIRVTVAKPGKKFITLDSESYTTAGGEVVFENPKGEIIDFPAIKGTANTAINDQTRNILFWIESVDASKVRFGSMTHAIRTVAAQLNEKNVDPNLGEPVLQEAVAWYQKLCFAQVASQVYDDFPGKAELPTVKVSLNQTNTYLGITLPQEKITSILETLECQVAVHKDVLIVTPPTFRPDIAIPADVIEEIARIYGYHNLPSTLMTGAIPTSKPAGLNLQLESTIKHLLADLGWQELYTYSLTSEAIALESGYPLPEHLKLQNPLTEDRIYLRRSLLPSLSEVLNNNPQRSDLSVFEMANVYFPQPDDLPIHELHLGIASHQTYRQVRGMIEVLFKKLFVKNLEITPTTKPVPGYTQAAQVSVKNTQLGYIGLNSQGYIVCELVMAEVQKVARPYPKYQPLPKTMPVIEDLTFTLPLNTAIGDVMKQISRISSLITTVSLKGSYERNFTFSLEYQDPNTNLEAKDIDPVRRQVVDSLIEKYQAVLVGQLQ